MMISTILKDVPEEFFNFQARIQERATGLLLTVSAAGNVDPAGTTTPQHVGLTGLAGWSYERQSEASKRN
jgi:hypothetical protein